MAGTGVGEFCPLSIRSANPLNAVKCFSQQMPVVAAEVFTEAMPILRRLLLQDLMHDAALDIGQAEVAAAVAVGQTRVVEPALVQ